MNESRFRFYDLTFRCHDAVFSWTEGAVFLFAGLPFRRPVYTRPSKSLCPLVMLGGYFFIFWFPSLRGSCCRQLAKKKEKVPNGGAHTEHESRYQCQTTVRWYHSACTTYGTDLTTSSQDFTEASPSR